MGRPLVRPRRCVRPDVRPRVFDCRRLAEGEHGSGLDDGHSVLPIGTVSAGDRLHILSEAESAEFLRVTAASRGVEDVAAEPTASDLPSAPPPVIIEADASQARSVDLRLFGRPQVLADGVEVRSGLRTRARALLVLLGVRAAGVTTEEALTDLWHEAGDLDADNSYFYTVVTSVRWRLRAVLGGTSR